MTFTAKEYAAIAILKCTAPGANGDFACESCIEQIVAKAMEPAKASDEGHQKKEAEQCGYFGRDEYCTANCPGHLCCNPIPCQDHPKTEEKP